jgi:hypothetical protein
VGLGVIRNKTIVLIAAAFCYSLEKSRPSGLRGPGVCGKVLRFKAKGLDKNLLKKALTTSNLFDWMNALFEDWTYVCCN